MSKDFKVNDDEIIDFSKATRQNILFRFAQSSKDTFGFSALIDYEICMRLYGRMGSEPLIKKLGKEQTEKNLLKLKQLGGIISNINFYLLHLEKNKTVSVADPKFIQARKYFAFAVQHLDLIYETLYILLDATPILKTLPIPNEYLSEHKEEYFEERGDEI